MSGSSRVTVFSRAQNYKKDGMYVFDKANKIMMCSFCNARVSWERKSTVDWHCSSEGHKKKVAASASESRSASQSNKRKQSSISDSFDLAKRAKQDKYEFVKSTVSAFVKANIPLSKVDHPAMRQWMQKYVPGAGDLARGDKLRKKIIPLLKDDYDDQLKAAVKNRKIVILCDETTNRKGEAVFIVLFKILPSETQSESRVVVAGAKVLASCTGELTSKCLIQVLNHFEVDYENVVALASDSAAYMNLCARLMKELVNPNLIHIQCWAHKLDKVIQIFPSKLPRLNEFVAKSKKLFKNTRKRKNNYFKLLKDKIGCSKAKVAKLFPLPVMTRWGSWRDSVEYVATYAEDIAEYAKSLEDDVKAVRYFKKLKSEDVQIVLAEASFVVQFCTPLTTLLKLVEGTKYPLSHMIYPKIKELISQMGAIVSGGIEKAVEKELKRRIEVLARPKKKNLIERMMTTTRCCQERLKELMEKDSAKEFFEAASSLFCPSKLIGLDDVSSSSLVPALKKKVPLLDGMSNSSFLVCHAVMRGNVKEALGQFQKPSGSDNLIVGILQDMKTRQPEFAIRCLQTISISVSNVDSERAFSAYGEILTARRTRLLQPNCEAFICLAFGDDFDLNMESEGEGSEPELSEIE